jgi:hypothetical protein
MVGKKRAVIFMAAAAVLFVGFASAQDSSVNAPWCSAVAIKKASWTDLGVIPGVSSARAITILHNQLLVGTDDGVWRRHGNCWVQSGLDGIEITNFLVFPGIIFAGADPNWQSGVRSLYISYDGARTWIPTGDELYDDYFELYIPVSEIVHQPGSNGVLYAAMSGTSIARSNDWGITWQYVFGGPHFYAASPSYLEILPGDSNTLYQGGQPVLDCPMIASYDISDPNDPSLDDDMRIILGMWDLEQRPPTILSSSNGYPNRLYVGLAGALIWIDLNNCDSWDWLWKYPDGDNFGAYTYIKAIWFDACDPNHLVFGGFENAPEQEFSLYETFDHGETITMIALPDGWDFENPRITAGTQYGRGKNKYAMLVNYDSPPSEGTEVTVLVREYFSPSYQMRRASHSSVELQAK